MIPADLTPEQRAARRHTRQAKETAARIFTEVRTDHPEGTSTGADAAAAAIAQRVSTVETGSAPAAFKDAFVVEIGRLFAETYLGTDRLTSATVAALTPETLPPVTTPTRQRDAA